MSQLYIRTTYAGQFAMNVLKFDAPMFGTMMEGQTKTKAVYFPIKAQQPELELDVIFASWADYQGFAAFVRSTQLNALHNDIEPGVTLWWPERNITNWTGVIRGFQGGAKRFSYAPKAHFVVDLVDSYVSSRTTIASVAPIFDTVFGLGSPDGMFTTPSSTIPTQTFPGIVLPGGNTGPMST